VAGRANLREQAVGLAQLSLAPLRVAALARQLGQLDVNQGLGRLGVRLPRQLLRPRQRRLNFRKRGGTRRAEQDPRGRLTAVSYSRIAP
jgi:hypothetical protein